jgi:prepilin-type processing-associated H-X9-DG protein
MFKDPSVKVAFAETNYPSGTDSRDGSYWFRADTFQVGGLVYPNFAWSFGKHQGMDPLKIPITSFKASSNMTMLDGHVGEFSAAYVYSKFPSNMNLWYQNPMFGN